MIATENTYLAIPRGQLKTVQHAAGKLTNGQNAMAFNTKEKAWYAKPGADLSKLQQWLPDKLAVEMDADPRLEFAQVLEEAGFELDGLPEMDGKRHRVKTTDDKNGEKTGVYSGFLDGVPAGWYQDHRIHAETQKWVSTGQKLNKEAQLHLRAIAAQKKEVRATAQARQYNHISHRVTQLYPLLPDAAKQHAYLLRKGVEATTGLKQDKRGRLVIPLRNAKGEIRTLQRIGTNGFKSLKKGGQKTGNFFVVGGELRPGQPILYAEGYSTAASISAAIGLPVVMAVDAGNLPHVASALQATYPDSKHMFLADDDSKNIANKGLIKANEAAKITQGVVLAPVFSPEEREKNLTDFNDLHHARDLNAVRDQITPQLDVLAPQWRTTPMPEQPVTRDNSIPLDAYSDIDIPQYSDNDVDITPVNNEIIQDAAPHDESVTDEALPPEFVPEPPLAPQIESVTAPESVETLAPQIEPIPEPVSTESLAPQTESVSEPEPSEVATPHNPIAEPASFVSMLNVNDTPPEDESHQEEMASSEQPQHKSVDNSIHIDPVDSAEDDQPRRAIPVDLDALLQNVTHEYEGNTVVYFHEGVRAFVDHGNHITMATPEASQNVTLVLAALLVARQHYHGKIELTGSDEFKQRAINLIAEHNLELVLKNPIQQLMLDEARKLLAQQRNDTPVSTPSVDGIVLTPANQTKPSALAVPGTQAPTVHATGTPQSQQRPQQDAAQPETTGLTGKLLAHGEAPYDFDDTNSMSYHVKMRTADGEKVIWGKELNGALADSGMNIGDIISLRCLGQQPVTVNSPVKDETGKILRWEKIDAMRNQWEVKSAIDNRLLVPDRQQAFPPASLLAYDMASFQQVQQTVIAASGITLPPLTNHSALLWLQPDGRGAAQHGNPQTAKLPVASQDSGTPVMTGHLPDGQLSLQLVKAHGDYLQGIVLHKGEYQHVLGQLCTRENGSRYLTLNIVEPDGLRPIGHGNAVNQVRGAVVAYDTFVFRLSGDNEKVVAKLDSPERMEAVLHKKLGFTKRFTPVAPISDAIVKAENKPLAKPDNTPRPGM